MATSDKDTLAGVAHRYGFRGFSDAATRESQVFTTRAVASPDDQVRYTKFVRLMKIMLPLTAVGLVVAVVLYSAISGFDDRFSFSVEGVSHDGDELEMDKPRLTFTDKEERSYDVTADSAVQNANTPNLWDLSAIIAMLTPNDGSWIRLTSTDGILDSEGELLDLSGIIKVFTRDGYEITAETAKVDFDEGTVVSSDPVAGTGPRGDIEADGFNIEDGGDRIFFRGNVKLTILPEQSGETEG
jgi:lipopolysaccharide export system protein LptC